MTASGRVPARPFDPITLLRGTAPENLHGLSRKNFVGTVARRLELEADESRCFSAHLGQGVELDCCTVRTVNQESA